MPAKHADDLKKTYAQVAQGYKQAHQEVVMIDQLGQFIKNLPAQAKILDLGAGTGHESRWFVDQRFEVTMFDLSADMLELAHQHVPEAKVVQGDMTEMSFEDENFDGVWANASLLHVTKDEAKTVVKKIKQILKSNGKVFISLKEGQGEQEVEDDKYGVPMKRFFALYDEEELSELLQQAGFRNIEIRHSQSRSGQNWVQAFARK